MRVALIDDSPDVQRSFADLLGSVSDMELVGCAQDVAGAMALVDARGPDLVVLDLELRHGGRGIEVARHIARAHPAVRVIVLSHDTRPATRELCRAAGVLACFDKASEFLLARRWIAVQAAAQAAAQGDTAGPGAAHRS